MKHRDEPRGRVQGHRPDLGLVHEGQDRRQASDGTIVAADGLFKFQAGAFPGSPVMNACMCAFAPYDIANARAIGYDVVCNRPKVGGLSRAGLADRRLRGGERDRRAAPRRSAWIRWSCGSRTLARIGTPTLAGPKLAHDGYRRDHRGAAQPSGLQGAAGAEPGARRRLRLLVQRRRRIRARRMQVNEDGTVRGRDRQPGHRRLARLDGDHGGGDAGRRLQPRAADRRRHRVGGLHASSPAARASPLPPAWRWSTPTKNVIKELCVRAAMIWDVDPEGVVWEDGYAKPASSNVGDFKPLSLKEIAAKAGGDRRADRRRGGGEPRRGRRPASPPSSATSRSIPRPAR